MNIFENEIYISAKVLGILYRKIPVAQRGPVKLRCAPYDGYIVYQGRHISLELKSTKELSSFPISRIAEHQVEGLLSDVREGCKSWLLLNTRQIKKKSSNKAWALDFSKWNEVIDALKSKNRKSIPKEWFIDGSQYLIEIPRMHVEDKENKKHLVWNIKELL